MCLINCNVFQGLRCQCRLLFCWCIYCIYSVSLYIYMCRDYYYNIKSLNALWEKCMTVLQQLACVSHFLHVVMIYFFFSKLKMVCFFSPSLSAMFVLIFIVSELFTFLLKTKWEIIFRYRMINIFVNTYLRRLYKILNALFLHFCVSVTALHCFSLRRKTCKIK